MTTSEDRAPGVDVLIADDDAPTRWLLRRLLEKQGFICAEAEDGPSAVALAQAAPPRCVLLDLVMPGLDGLDTLALLRKLDPHVRVALMTGYNAPREEELARAGASALFFKPFDFAQVQRFLVAHPGPAGRALE